MPTIASFEIIICRLDDDTIAIQLPGKPMEKTTLLPGSALTYKLPVDITLGGVLVYSDNDLTPKADKPVAK